MLKTPGRRITFEVTGVAQPKGSTRAFVPLSWAQKAAAAGVQPHAAITSANPRVMSWQSLVAYEARLAARHCGLFAGGVRLQLQFYLPRPASLPKKQLLHVRKPDLDKLIRSTGDALIGVLFKDDNQVTDITASKVYSAGVKAPHAIITVEDADYRSAFTEEGEDDGPNAWP